VEQPRPLLTESRTEHVSLNRTATPAAIEPPRPRGLGGTGLSPDRSSTVYCCARAEPRCGVGRAVCEGQRACMQRDVYFVPHARSFRERVRRQVLTIVVLIVVLYFCGSCYQCFAISKVWVFCLQWRWRGGGECLRLVGDWEEGEDEGL